MNEATRQFIRQHADDDVRQLALRGTKQPDVDLTLALQQIQGRQTARHKLPTWSAIDGIVYPPRLNMEQCSSEQTARYKAQVARQLLAAPAPAASPVASPAASAPAASPTGLAPAPAGFPAGPATTPAGFPAGSSLVDLTGGLGVDFSFMSQAFGEAVYVERDAQLCALAASNFRLLCEKPVQTVCADGMDYLRTVDHCTMFFLDPARRDDHGGRTYALADCTPNVLPVMDELLRRADYVMLKLSPMLDWRKAVSDLGEARVRQVHIVATANECKELLIVIAGNATQQRPALQLICVNDGSRFIVDYAQDHEKNTCPFTPLHSPSLPLTPQDTPHHTCPFTPPHSPSLPFTPQNIPQITPQHTFLYEPNAAIMKAGCFAELSARFSVAPLSPNSHLFVSPQPVADFPGRGFQVVALSTLAKRDLKSTLGHLRQANITVRNFPLTVAELRSRLRLSDGGNDYIFATTLSDGSHVLFLCQKIAAA